MQNNSDDNSMNVTFTLPASVVSWIKRTAIAEDLNQSQLARKVFRTYMESEAKTKLVKAKGGKK